MPQISCFACILQASPRRMALPTIRFFRYYRAAKHGQHKSSYGLKKHQEFNCCLIPSFCVEMVP